MSSILSCQITCCSFRVYLFFNWQIASYQNPPHYFSTWFAISLYSLLFALVVYHTSIILLPRTTTSCIDTASATAVQDTFWDWSVKVTSDRAAQANSYFCRKSEYLFSLSNRSSMLLRYTCFRTSYWFCSQVYNSKNNEQLIGKKTRQWSTVILYQTSSNLYSFFACSLSIYCLSLQFIPLVCCWLFWWSMPLLYAYCLFYRGSKKEKKRRKKVDKRKKKLKVWLVSHIISYHIISYHIISSAAQRICPKAKSKVSMPSFWQKWLSKVN